MKVEVISLMLIASLAMVAALPVGSSAPSSIEREERARKDSAKLRLLEAALAQGTRVDKERRTENAHSKKQEGDQEPSESKIAVSKSESTRSGSKATPATTTTMATTTTVASTTPKSDFVLRLEKQRSVADQAFRERLMRHTGPQKEQRVPLARNSPQPAAVKAPPQQQEMVQQKGPGGGPSTYPPVVYVPLSDVHESKQGGGGGAVSPLRLAPYVPAAALYGTNRASWPFASYFPVLINDPYQAIIGSGPLFEYGQEADVCSPKYPARDAGADAGGGGGAPTASGPSGSDTEIAMAGSGYVTKVVVRGGGVAIAGPGGVATVGRGGTAIVGPGGVAYTRPGALAVVGPGGKVLSQRKHQGVYVAHGEDNSALGRSDHHDGVLVARGPVIYYDDFEERE